MIQAKPCKHTKFQRSGGVKAQVLSRPRWFQGSGGGVFDELRTLWRESRISMRIDLELLNSVDLMITASSAKCDESVIVSGQRTL